MKPSTASVAAISGLATIVAADGLPIDSIPFSCIRICGPVVELTNICNLGPMANSRLLAKRDATIPGSQQLKQRGVKNARYRRHKSKKGKRGGFEVLIPPPTTFPPGPVEPPEPTAVKPGPDPGPDPGPGPDGGPGSGPKEPPAPPVGGPHQPPTPPPTQDPEKGPDGPGKEPEPKPKPPHEHDDEAETTDAQQAPETTTVTSIPEPSAPEAVIEVPSSSFATTTKKSSLPSPPEETQSSTGSRDAVKEEPSAPESTESAGGKAPKSVSPAESDVATDAGGDDNNDDDGDDDSDEQFDDADNSNGAWDLKGAEESCVCQNDSFDVAYISAMCASCVDQAGDLQNNINLILHTCDFPRMEYTTKEERAADGIRVKAERPSLPLNAAINVEQDDGSGSLTSKRMTAAAAAAVAAVASGFWCLL